MTGYGPLWSMTPGRRPGPRGRDSAGWSSDRSAWIVGRHDATLATTSGPLVASRVLWYGSLAASRRTSPSVSVVVAAMIASSSSAASARRRRRSRTARRPTSRRRPTRSVLQPDEGAELPGGAAGQPGLVDERAVAHRDQPVRGGRDPRVVGDDDQRLPGLVQALEELQDVQGGGAVEVAGGFVGEDDQRLVAQRPGDRDPLPLAAGQRRGQEAAPGRRARPAPAAPPPAVWRPAASVRPAAPTARRSRRR